MQRYIISSAEVGLVDKLQYERFDLAETIQYIEELFRAEPNRKEIPSLTELSAALGPSRPIFSDKQDKIFDGLKALISVEGYAHQLKKRIEQAIEVSLDLVQAAVKYIEKAFEDIGRKEIPIQRELSVALGPSQVTFSNRQDEILDGLEALISVTGYNPERKERTQVAIELKRASRRKSHPAGDLFIDGRELSNVLEAPFCKLAEENFRLAATLSNFKASNSSAQSLILPRSYYSEGSTPQFIGAPLRIITKDEGHPTSLIISDTQVVKNGARIKLQGLILGWAEYFQGRYLFGYNEHPEFTDEVRLLIRAFNGEVEAIDMLNTRRYSFSQGRWHTKSHPAGRDFFAQLVLSDEERAGVKETHDLMKEHMRLAARAVGTTASRGWKFKFEDRRG